MERLKLSALAYKKRILSSELTIYDRIDLNDPKFWIPTPELEMLLQIGLAGFSVAGLPNRTRSKVVKEKVCLALGYAIPKIFKKTQPRFTGQNFDTYIQKSNNLQIWNEDISLSRRYVIIEVSEKLLISTVKVIDGAQLSKLDTTGKLTQKYQAGVGKIKNEPELFSLTDTENLLALCTNVNGNMDVATLPTEDPHPELLMPIQTLFNKLKILVGKEFKDIGRDQERNRGSYLHSLICKALQYTEFKDNGKFPDIRHQLLEVKLQTSPTIDLGLITPDSAEGINIPKIRNVQLRHCDTRYAIFCGSITNGTVKISGLILTTGENFFARFARFEGKVLNKKLQLRLPKNFFDIKSK